jgi:hypothetical protein
MMEVLSRLLLLRDRIGSVQMTRERNLMSIYLYFDAVIGQSDA